MSAAGVSGQATSGKKQTRGGDDKNRYYLRTCFMDKPFYRRIPYSVGLFEYLLNCTAYTWTERLYSVPLVFLSP